MGNNVNSTDGYRYTIGDYIQYRQNGICEVVDIRAQKFELLKEKIFYVLRCIRDDSVIYVPVDASNLNNHMKSILTREEVDEVINKCFDLDIEWIEDGKERNNEYMKIVNSGDRASVLWVVATLSEHKDNVERENKKFYASDEKILSLAERIIIDEFAFVLGVDREGVVDYILNCRKCRLV